MAFEPISLKDNKDGLVYHTTQGPYLVELQTGIWPNILHLIVFNKDTNEPLYDKVGAFEYGDTLEDRQTDLAAEVTAALVEAAKL